MKKTDAKVINLDITDPNLFSPIYVPVINDRNRYIIMYGSRDSGKSYTAAQKVIYHLLTEKYCKCVCLRKTYADIKDSQFETLWAIIETWKLDHMFKYIKNPLEITCLVNGNQILARGLDKPAKLKSIKDVSMVWAEEADEILFIDFIKSDTSIRAPAGTLLQFIMTFNPELEECWINEHFFPPKDNYEKADGCFHHVKATQPLTTILHTTYKDNSYCPPERATIYQGLNKHIKNIDFFKTYALGLWGSAIRGLVFPVINYVDEFPDILDCHKYGYGIDWGFSADPTAVVECAIYNKEIYLREIIYQTELMITGEHSLQTLMEERGIDSNVCMIADSSEPRTIREVRRLGYNIKPVKKERGSVAAGLTSMRQYPINIVGSPNLKKEVRTYRYKETKYGFTTEPIDAWNHAIDASRYWWMENVMNKRGDFKARTA